MRLGPTLVVQVQVAALESGTPMQNSWETDTGSQGHGGPLPLGTFSIEEPMVQGRNRSPGFPGPISVTEDNLAALLNQVDAVLLAIDERGHLQFVSPSARLVLGYEPSLLRGRPVVEFMHPDDEHIFHEQWKFALKQSGPSALPTIRVLSADSNWVSMTLDVYAGADVEPFGVLLATLKPVEGATVAVQALRERLTREDRLVTLASTFVGLAPEDFDNGVTSTLAQLGTMPGVDRCTVMWIKGDVAVRTHEWCGPNAQRSDREEIPLHWFQHLFGPDLRNEIYLDIPELLEPVDPRRSPAADVAGADSPTPTDGPVTVGLGEMKRDGVRSMLGVPLLHDGALAGMVAFGSTEVGPLRNSGSLTLLRSAAALLSEAFARHDAEMRLAEQARTDLVTGLDNRWAFMEAVTSALAAPSESPSTVALLLMDLDRFKVVNDSLGHMVGDELLREIAVRLRDTVTPDERIGRLGGDELVVLLNQRDTPDTAQVRCLELMTVFDEPFRVGVHEFSVSASGGLAIASRGTTPQELLSQADAAMFRAKEMGRSRLAMFDQDLRRSLGQRLHLENEIRTAVRNNELTLHYQPELHLPTRTIHGVEALVRWNHPTRGLLTAAEFIDITEEIGLVVELGEWVLHEACRQLSEWREAGLSLVMRVNVSAKQLNHPEFIDRLIEVMETCSPEPHTLCLELTETAVMADADLSLEVLSKIAGLGIQLAIDDFGTGYSSLSYLKRLPMNVLKIDRTFVDGLSRSADDVAIVAAILSLARTLGMTVTAEGIETEDQLQSLMDLGCKFGQGWLFSKAVPPEVIERYLREGLTPT